MPPGSKMAKLRERLRGKGYKAGNAPIKPATDKPVQGDNKKAGLINRS